LGVQVANFVLALRFVYLSTTPLEVRTRPAGSGL